MLANWIQLAFPGQTLPHVQVVVIVSASDVRSGCDLQLVHATHFSVLVGSSTHVQINTVWCQVFFPLPLVYVCRHWLGLHVCAQIKSIEKPCLLLIGQGQSLPRCFQP